MLFKWKTIVETGRLAFLMRTSLFLWIYGAALALALAIFHFFFFTLLKAPFICCELSSSIHDGINESCSFLQNFIFIFSQWSNNRRNKSTDNSIGFSHLFNFKCFHRTEWVRTRIMYTASVWLWPNLIIHQRVERNNHNHKCTATSVVCNSKTPKKNIHSKNKYLQQLLRPACWYSTAPSWMWTSRMRERQTKNIYMTETQANASLNALKRKKRARAHALTQTNDEWEGRYRHPKSLVPCSTQHWLTWHSKRERETKKTHRRTHEN